MKDFSYYKVEVEYPSPEYGIERANKEREFWDDARETLGYKEKFNSDQISAIEYKAWENGHSAGYSEVYWHLQDLVEFVSDVIERGRRLQ